MLVLSRKCQEAVVVGPAVGGAPLLTVTVLEVVGTQVKLGFQADASVVVHRWEVWQRAHADGQSLAAMTRESSGKPPPEVAVGVHDTEVTPGADKGTQGRPPDPERDLREGRWLDDGGQE